MPATRLVSVPVTQFQLLAMLSEKLGDFKGKGWINKLMWWLARIFFAMRSWFMDLEYNTMPVWMLQEALDKWREEVLPSIPYQGEYNDCDDFAMRFRVWLADYTRGRGIPAFNGVGIALGMLYRDGRLLGGHAWNLVLVTDEAGRVDVVFVEPQIGEIVSMGRAPDGLEYQLMAVIV